MLLRLYWLSGRPSRDEFGFWLIWVEPQRFFLPCISALFSSLSSEAGAAGGRRWVLCSLATPSVDGDWYAALFKRLSLSEPERGTPEQSRPYSGFPSSPSMPGHIDMRGQISQLNGDQTQLTAAVLSSETQGPPTSVKGLQVAPQ